MGDLFDKINDELHNIRELLASATTDGYLLNDAADEIERLRSILCSGISTRVNGDAFVPQDDCSATELAYARQENRLLVDSRGYQYIVSPKKTNKETEK